MLDKCIKIRNDSIALVLALECLRFDQKKNAAQVDIVPCGVKERQREKRGRRRKSKFHFVDGFLLLFDIFFIFVVVG